MELQECINDPLFRKEFVLHEIEALKGAIDGNENILYHNDAKLSILDEIKEKLSLTEIEKAEIDEHITALRSIRSEATEQNRKLQILVNIYEKFQNQPIDSKLKLA